MIQITHKPPKLAVIIPSIRELDALPTIKSALEQVGFDTVDVVVAGKSCSDDAFRSACRKLSSHILLGNPHDMDRIPPGMARNECLKIMEKRLADHDYVLFVDDDIILPVDFAITLVRFIRKENPVAAAMGRVVSTPRTYWMKVIDYSNFWWLQIEENVTDMNWLGAGATLIPIEKIGGITFNEWMYVNEDTDFFQKVAKTHRGKLGICAEVTCFHNHKRGRFREFVKYQFNNGRRSKFALNSRKFSIKTLLKRFRDTFLLYKKALIANRRFLVKRPHIALGILLSFTVYAIGIQVGKPGHTREYRSTATSGEH